MLTWSRLDEHVLLADAAQAMAMVAAGASRLVDLRGEASPPRLPVVVDRFPIEDLQPDQDDLILAAARHVHDLATAGLTVGVYCQAGVSRTATVGIAYLLLGGLSLEEAAARVRDVRPEARPALALWHSLERITAALGG